MHDDLYDHLSNRRVPVHVGRAVRFAERLGMHGRLLHGSGAVSRRVQVAVFGLAYVVVSGCNTNARCERRNSRGCPVLSPELFSGASEEQCTMVGCSWGIRCTPRSCAPLSNEMACREAGCGWTGSECRLSDVLPSCDHDAATCESDPACVHEVACFGDTLNCGVLDEARCSANPACEWLETDHNPWRL